MSLTLRPLKSGLVAKNIVSKQLTFQGFLRRVQPCQHRIHLSLGEKLRHCFLSCRAVAIHILLTGTSRTQSPTHDKKSLLLPALPASACETESWRYPDPALRPTCRVLGQEGGGPMAPWEWRP